MPDTSPIPSVQPDETDPRFPGRTVAGTWLLDRLDANGGSPPFAGLHLRLVAACSEHRVPVLRGPSRIEEWLILPWCRGKRAAKGQHQHLRWP